VVEGGTTFGAPTEGETLLAKRIIDAFPSIELLRFVNSGTEAVMSAIRVARGYTGREKIIKFEGCYHGHVDSLLVKGGSGMATLSIPCSKGVPKDFVHHTLVVPFNDLERVASVIKQEANNIAAVLIEPVAGNMGVVLPKDGFLQELRKLTQRDGILLIFDEVITGFRNSFGGAQKHFDVVPDLTCLGKIIGGGFPIGAYGGKREIMECVSPDGEVYQAGTLSGNPVAVAAGAKVLEILSSQSFYEELEWRSKLLFDGLVEGAKSAGVEIFPTRFGSMMCFFFTGERVVDYETAKNSNLERYKKFFNSMLAQGVYLPPSQFESFFLSSAHSKEDIEYTVEVSFKAFRDAR
jgi:glutamate-1-semialdehyde 2,1-aminomutase